MPSFAEMRDKAAKAKDASVTKMQNTRDRHTSVPLKDTNWNPYEKNPPPPLAPRANVNTRPQPTFLPPPQRAGSTASPDSTTSSPAPAASGPPPIARATRPSLPSSSASPPPSTPSRPAVSRFRQPEVEHEAFAPPPPVRRVQPSKESEKQLDWANLSPEDKEVFFSWLDEFFSRYLNKPIPAQ